tara:strand:- start:21765 stop:23306 length:1542 start_codon:yes stop_codon:yes gene_type:complete
MKALLSVYDKTGISDLGKVLTSNGIQLVSTGGTYSQLSSANLPVLQVADITGFPEMLGGRVKTLHPNIHAGILAKREDPDQLAELSKHGIEQIDIVVVNLYPFQETINKPDVTLDEALENIDIGGPTMLRAAAKNFLSVVVLVDPDDYQWVAAKIINNQLNPVDRQHLAAKAFKHVSDYDRTINSYLSTADSGDHTLPHNLSLNLTKLEELRYGENPHQSAALYSASSPANLGIAGAKQIHGKELSFNNILDANAAWSIVNDFEEPTIAIIKHGNSCGLCSNADITEAYRRALEGDPVSAFGGIIGSNCVVNAAMAQEMKDVFYEVLLAPGFEPEALEILQKRRNLRILTVAKEQHSPNNTYSYDYRLITGGFLVQTQDNIQEDFAKWNCVTRREPNASEYEDLVFAWRAAKHIKSNAIVFAKDKTLTGMGAGQPNRVVSVHLSERVAGEKAPGSVLASDAFFPFPDNIELAAAAGITAVIQPGGSIRDEEVINAANQHNLAMLFTGTRHFKH